MNNMKIEKLEQGSEEWFAAREGRLTASNAQAIATAGKGLETYIIKIMSEKYSKGERKSFSNEHTDRGNELEGKARELYSFSNNVEVEEVGLIEMNEYVSCSPDGLVGDEGGIEIKCIDDFGYFKFFLEGEKNIESKYLWQIQMNLFITKRKWWDFVAYNPNYDKPIFVYRILPDKDKFKKLEIGIEAGTEKIKQINKKLS